MTKNNNNSPGLTASSILVAYATRYGSTQEVAEAVAATLRKQGLGVDTQAVRKVRSLAGYRAIVLGVPLYMGSMPKDAQKFLQLHQTTLEQMPVAIFALGPTLDPPDEREWQETRAQLDKALAKFAWLRPVTIEMFGGKFDPAKFNIPHRLISALPASPLHNLPASDIRDWDAIHAWASDLAEKLLLRS